MSAARTNRNKRLLKLAGKLGGIVALAEALGVSYTTAHQWVSGYRCPNPWRAMSLDKRVPGFAECFPVADRVARLRAVRDDDAG